MLIQKALCKFLQIYLTKKKQFTLNKKLDAFRFSYGLFKLKVVVSYYGLCEGVNSCKSKCARDRGFIISKTIN